MPVEHPFAEGVEMARDFQVTIDCADPARLARFWAEALGYQVQGPPAGYATWDEALDAFNVPTERRNDAAAVIDPDGTGPRVFLQRVPEGKQTKNRLHLDVRVAPGLTGEERMRALAAEADRLTTLGAAQLYRFEPAPPLESGHIVLADPEGNEFCLD
jgi:catechol 2,3-dioxygenase-like lactoylglutathione lyase family enzyme